MKDKKFSNKMFFLSGVLVGFILCGVIFLVATNDTDDRNIKRFRKDATFFETKILSDEIELIKSLRNFEKIYNAMVNFGTSHNEIISVTIYLETTEEISDSEIDDIIQFVSERFKNLDNDNIAIILLPSNFFGSTEYESINYL
ncbi:MAG: hypothetical protein FWE14_12705 [Lachnospiraceae bacterium]|nr:hypothetical protein [Lachnospiraceae bacterium]